MKSLLPLAVAAMVGVPVSASAENHLSQGKLDWVGSWVYFDQVNSDTTALVEVRNYNGRTIGSLLGSQAVTQGSNPGIRVHLAPAPFHENRDGIALLVVDGAVVASREVDLRLHPGSN